MRIQGYLWCQQPGRLAAGTRAALQRGQGPHHVTSCLSVTSALHPRSGVEDACARETRVATKAYDLWITTGNPDAKYYWYHGLHAPPEVALCV